MKKQFISALLFFAATAKAGPKNNQIVKVSGREVELAKLDKMLQGMEEGDEITADYFEIGLSEEVRAVVLGRRPFKTKEAEGKPSREVDAILLYANGKKVVAAQSMLVSNLLAAAKKAEEQGILTPVSITYESDEKAAVGKYAKFRIVELV